MNKSKTNSVKEFKKEYFSKENFLMLYKLLNSSVKKNYNQNMSKDDKEYIADIMKEIYDSNKDIITNKDLSIKDNRDNYINKFNKKLLDNILPELSKKYKSISEKNLINVHKVVDRPANTTNKKENKDINKQFNELIENRTINTAPKQNISFEDEDYIASQKNKTLRNKNSSKNRENKDKISNISGNVIDVNNDNENVKTLSDYFNQPKLDSKNKELTKFYEENNVNDILEETLKQRETIIEPNNKPDKKTLETQIKLQNVDDTTNNITKNTTNVKTINTRKIKSKNTMPELPKNNLDFNNNLYSDVNNTINENNENEINIMKDNASNYDNISNYSENTSDLLNELTSAESVVSFENYNEDNNDYETADNVIFGADLNTENIDNEVDNYVENLDYNLEKNELSKMYKNNDLNNDTTSDTNSVNESVIYDQLEKNIDITHKFSDKLDKLNTTNADTNVNVNANVNANTDINVNTNTNMNINNELFTSLNNTLNNLNSTFVDYKQSMIDYKNQNNDNYNSVNNNFNDYNKNLSNLFIKNQEKSTNNNELIKVVLEEINDNILANKQHYNNHQNILNNNLKNLENLNNNFEIFSSKMDVLFDNITKKLDNNSTSKHIEKIHYNSNLKHNLLDNPNNVSFKLDNKYKQIKFDKIIVPKSLVNNYINKYVKLYFKIYSDINDNIKTIEYDVNIENDDQFYYLINNETNYIDLELNQSTNYYINLSLFDYMNRPININNDYLKALTIMNIYLDENNEKIPSNSINNSLIAQGEDSNGNQIYKNIKKYSLIKFDSEFKLRENNNIKLSNFKINLEENGEQKNINRTILLKEKEKIFNNITKIEKINSSSGFIVDFNLDDITFDNLGVLTYDSINISYILSGVY